MKKLSSVEEYKELQNGEGVVFLFSAPWCKDCVFIEPQMPEIESSFPEFEFVYVNRDEYIDLCIEEEIFGIPSFIMYKKGEVKGRFVSKDRKTKEEIEAFIESCK